MVVEQRTDSVYKKKVKYIVVKFSDIFESNRLEASYYNKEGKRSRDLVKNYKGEKILVKNLLSRKAFVPPPIKRIFTDNYDIGTPYVTPSELLKTPIESKKYVIAKKMNDIQSWFVKSNWLIITQSGLVGIPILATHSMEKFVVSQNAIRLVFKDENDSLLLYAFFKSKLGHNLVTHNIYGSVVTHIEPEHMENITIPIFPQNIKNEVVNKINKCINLREEANALENEAIEILEKFILNNQK